MADQNEDDQAFFLTENVNQPEQPSGVNFDNQGNDGDIFDEDFGKMKMEIFKQKCRNILGVDQEVPQVKKPTRTLAEEQMIMNNDLYTGDEDYAEESVQAEVVDIVTAYKSLKLAMNKNMKGLGEAA